MSNEVKRWYRKYVDNAWCIGYRKIGNETESILGGNKKGAGKFELLCPSFRYWYADPILFSYEGSTYVFMEVYDKLYDKGSIGVSKFSKSGKLLKPSIIIKEKFHLSFPEIFEYEGHVYLIPESNSVNQIRIYRMGESVYQWEKYYSFHTKRQYSDSVIYNSGTKVFLLCTDKKKDNVYKNKLHIFELKNLSDRSQIELKKTNVKTSDYSYSIRNGGSLFRYNGEIFRVIQEAEYKAYGKNLAFRRIIQCDENTFRESDNVLKIEFGDIEYEINKILYEVRGIHTYGMIEGRMEVIDLNLTEISLIGLFKRVNTLRCLFCDLWRRKGNAD